ncbi:M28 family metallopeptidase [Vibrio kyushuensis]|uniref:M28 family peptidase n=1 Tax=Vibrio kyushuensis TaxID=2910249 RepID=UPI003D0F605B
MTDKTNDQENKSGSLASTPEQLIKLISDAAFSAPQKYLVRKAAALESSTFTIEQRHLEQRIDADTDPRSSINKEEMIKWTDDLVAISKQSKDDGNILWGRIQGTKYERESLDWAEEKLKSFGIKEVHHDKFPSGQQQWRPTKNELRIVSAPSIDGFEALELTTALTAFESKSTPVEGVEAELIFVGDGTNSELRGRDLEGKIVLLRARVNPGALMSTARVAYSRIASGKWGNPAGVIIWFDIPKVSNIAGRVGAPGGADEIGNAIPWTGINYEDGVYLRKLLDRSDETQPVTAYLNIQGVMDQPEDRMTGNVYGILPGKSEKFIHIMSHMDSYFYGLHDNGVAIAKNMALAKYYASLPQDEREYGLVFMFHGDHEVPGLGGTREYVKKWKQEIDENLLLVIRSEHLGMQAKMDEGVIDGDSNVTMPLLLTLTNQSPALIKILEEAQHLYTLPSSSRAITDPSADEMAFYPPHYTPPEGKPMPISVGWIQTGLHYHTTADVEQSLISFDAVEKYTRAHAYIIDQVFKITESDLRKNDVPYTAENNIYNSDATILTLGDW